MNDIPEKTNVVNDAYLWDHSAPFNVQIAQLEQKLSPLKYVQASRRAGFDLPRRAVPRPIYRAAAAIFIAICAVGLASMFFLPRHTTAWDVTTLSGAPTIGAERILRNGQLRVGQWLETDSTSQALVSVASIGRITIDPDSRLRLVESHETQHRLQLAHGRIAAFITAPPRLFLVDTPSTTAVDLGCQYNLSVDDDGAGLLEVSLGWVSLERSDGVQESIVPRGAQCHTRKGIGPGTPYFEDSPLHFQAELQRFDFDNGGDAALQAVLDESRQRDTLTLWHLLARSSGVRRQRILDRLASLSPPPKDVDQDLILKGDRAALRAWLDSFAWSPPPGFLDPEKSQ